MAFLWDLAALRLVAADRALRISIKHPHLPRAQQLQLRKNEERQINLALSDLHLFVTADSTGTT